MKKYFILSLLLSGYAAISCPACEKAQPEPLRGITHGAGPESNWDLVIVLITVIITLACFGFAVKYLIKPGESNEEHIKNRIIKYHQ